MFVKKEEKKRAFVCRRGPAGRNLQAPRQHERLCADVKSERRVRAHLAAGLPRTPSPITCVKATSETGDYSILF